MYGIAATDIRAPFQSGETTIFVPTNPASLIKNDISYNLYHAIDYTVSCK
jgi:hypothetical protein